MLRLPALPAMLSSLGIIGVIAVLDMFWVFGQLDVGLNTVFLLAELATIFIATVAVKYVVEERGKRFIRSTFSKYLAPTVVDQMLRDPSKLQLGGETRRLTIMMSDLRGFTAMAERMKPAEVLTVLNHYLGTMADIIVAHNGTIDEFIGDAILVIFGAPIEGKDDARRAVACAIAMQQAMVGINEHNARLGLPRLEMGIAVNTGEVIVGNIGSQKHIKYGVVGSHVNLTARIESNTVGGQVLVSGSTLELAGPDVVVGDKQLITAKGFAEPIPAHDVRGIGGEYALHLPEVDLELVALATPVEVRARVMTGKNEEGPEQVGTLVQLSGLGATLELPAPAEALTNLKLRLVGDGGALVDGDLYGKVTTGGCPLRGPLHRGAAGGGRVHRRPVRDDGDHHADHDGRGGPGGQASLTRAGSAEAARAAVPPHQRRALDRQPQVGGCVDAQAGLDRVVVADGRAAVVGRQHAHARVPARQRGRRTRPANRGHRRGRPPRRSWRRSGPGRSAPAPRPRPRGCRPSARGRSGRPRSGHCRR